MCASRIASHGQVPALALVLQILMVMSISFYWNHKLANLSQFSSSEVRQFGAILTFKLIFFYSNVMDSNHLDHSGGQNSSFLMIIGNSDGQGECSSLPFSPNAPQSCLSHPLHDILCLEGAFPLEFSDPTSILLWLCIYMVNISVKEREIFTLKYLIKSSFRDEWIGKSKHFIFIK